MIEADIQTENQYLLIWHWARLLEGRTAGALGLNDSEARMLARMQRGQVERAAAVDYPLFALNCTPEVLEGALHGKGGGGVAADDPGLVLLVNRWRACAGPYLAAQMKYGLSRPLYQQLANATQPMLLEAAASGVQLMHLAVRPQYLFHAGARFEFSNVQRTTMAICARRRAA